jgi:type III secretory pathway component EscR
MHRFMAAVLLSGALLAPAALKADDHPRDDRYYDRNARDYHQWNDSEDRAYRQYLTEHHRKYRDFKRLSAKQQREYWEWRHHHDEHH